MTLSHVGHIITTRILLNIKLRLSISLKLRTPVGYGSRPMINSTNRSKKKTPVLDCTKRMTPSHANQTRTKVCLTVNQSNSSLKRCSTRHVSSSLNPSREYRSNLTLSNGKLGKWGGLITLKYRTQFLTRSDTLGRRSTKPKKINWLGSIHNRLIVQLDGHCRIKVMCSQAQVSIHPKIWLAKISM